MMQAALEQSAVILPEPLEGLLKAQLHPDEGIARSCALRGVVLMATQQEFRHGGNHGAREEIGGQHGEYDGFT